MKFACASVFALACVAMAAPANAGNSGVNIIYPPKLAPDFKAAEERKAETGQETRVRVYVVPGLRSFYRWRERRRVNRALFQNYLSDRTSYSGRLYPF